jgi:hypothetical protein
MQTCSTCNYESPASAKFCRQCGAPLYAESDLSGASTRNYGRQEAAPAAPVSAPLPPSVADLFGANTARHYQTPQAYVQPVSNTAPIMGGSVKFRSWRLIAFALVVLFVGVCLGAFLAPGKNHRDEQPVSPEELAQMNAEAQRQMQQQQMADRIREAQERAREAQDRIREAQQRVREAAERAAESGAPLAPGDAKPLNLTQYEYPAASVGNYSHIPGSEMLQMRTKDSFDTIKEFYEKKLGKPLLLINDGDDRSLFFQSNTSPAVLVSVEHDDDSGGWQITVTRAPFQFAQPEAPKVASGAAKQ